MDLTLPAGNFVIRRNGIQRAAPDSVWNRVRRSMTSRSGNRDSSTTYRARSANVSRIVSVELAGESLAAIEAWREVHRLPTLEQAVEELLRKALMDEISGIEDLVAKARARLGLGMFADDGEN